MNYSIKINEFEGPLDLLLHLIKESSIDIYDISIEDITKDYLDYINSMEKLDIEVESSYLVMASELLLIKSNSLLPKEKSELDNEEEDEEITRENLINRLIEYQKYKELTKEFKKLESKRRDIYTKSPSNMTNITDTKLKNDTDISIDDLVEAFQKFLIRKDQEKPLNTKITNKEYSVKLRKKDIKTYLSNNKRAEFTELFDNYSKDYIIVTFLSILELVKEQEIDLEQEHNFAPIYIELIES
mgnify:CR=1 FL=1